MGQVVKAKKTATMQAKGDAGLNRYMQWEGEGFDVYVVPANGGVLRRSVRW